MLTKCRGLLVTSKLKRGCTQSVVIFFFFLEIIAVMPRMYLTPTKGTSFIFSHLTPPLIISLLLTISQLKHLKNGDHQERPRDYERPGHRPAR